MKINAPGQGQFDTRGKMLTTLAEDQSYRWYHIANIKALSLVPSDKKIFKFLLYVHSENQCPGGGGNFDLWAII
jgi:hypothetical protein